MKFSSLAATLLAIVLCTTVYAGVPGLISYQGQLTDDLGQPVDTVVDIRFTMYADSAGTKDIWKETYAGVQVKNGIFHVLLGSYSPFTSVELDGSIRYLGLKIGSDQESEPLVPMVSTSYAIRAGGADTADYATYASSAGSSSNSTHSVYADTADHVLGLVSTGWVKDGSLVHLDDDDNTVSIGHSSPEFRLDVRDSRTAIYGRSLGSAYMAGVYGRAEYDAFGVMGTSSNGRGVYGASTTGFGGYFSGARNYLSDPTGVGTDNPTHTLTVDGDIALQSGGTTQFHINYGSNGLKFNETGASTHMVIKNGGNVGIGTEWPVERLHVAGDLKVNGRITAETLLSTTINDEAGLTTDEFWDWQSMSGSWSTVVSRTIVAPGPGYVTVIASVELYMDHDATGGTALNFGISRIPDSVGTYDDYTTRLPSGADAGVYYYGTTIHEVFEVGSAGNHQFYFLARETSDNNVYVTRRNLTCIFFPTAYGSVSKSRDGDQSSIIAQPDVDSNTLDVVAELAALKAEVAELKQQLEGQTSE